MRKILGPVLALSALLLLYPLVPLYGHAILLSASPASNQVVQGAAVEVQLRFNARIDAARSRLVLALPGGRERLLSANQPSPDTLTSEVSGLVPGPYILRWQVLAQDGHITRGLVPFRAQ
jgi:methionine-rich copper-binding protein CopC